ncbi:hypothetical protein [Pseudodesulfovibrio pelocollis]|uniref:hypothetical protein n=1 Tax=Pseudodesulfovibrio pelocollis TaxID=3051432 RepID=UPI00255B0194|nr:hypothetical protein [Pseudodesulfovibrio sp. SB368]
MGAEVLKEFLTRLGFEVDEAGMKKFNSSLASSTTRALAFGAAVKAAATGIYWGLYKIAEEQDALLKISESTGTAVSSLEEMGYVAEQTGASTDKLHSSLANLQAKMAEATLGRGGIEFFQRLGIRVKDTNGQLRDTMEVLSDVGERIKGMDRGRQEMFLNQLGIDRDLVSMLTSDVDGLREAYREMFAASGMDAQKSAEASRGFVAEVKSIKTVLMMLAKSVGLGVITRMQADIVRFRKTIIENFKRISITFQKIIALIMNISGAISTLVMRIFGWIGVVVGWFSRLDDSVQKIILGILGFAAAWKFLNLSFLATPLGMFIALAAVIVGLIDDFQTWLEGGESLIDWGNGWGITLGALVAGLAAFKMALIAIPAVMGAISTAGTVMAGVIRAIGMAAAANPIGMMVAGFALAATLIITNWETVKAWFGAFVDWLGGAFDWVGQVASGVARFFGGGEQAGAPRSAALAPSPAQAAAVGNSSASINASTVIHVDGSGSPEATARAVGRSQAGVNADLVRHARGAAR